MLVRAVGRARKQSIVHCIVILTDTGCCIMKHLQPQSEMYRTISKVLPGMMDHHNVPGAAA